MIGLTSKTFLCATASAFLDMYHHTNGPSKSDPDQSGSSKIPCILFSTKFIILANKLRLNGTYPHPLYHRIVLFSMDRLCAFLLQNFPRPTPHEIENSLFLCPGNKPLEEALRNAPSALVPFAVMRTLLFQHRAIIDIEGAAWTMFSEIYGEPLLRS